MEVDFKEFRRKDLQRLCKKHGLRANATNSQMADSLASFFKTVEKNKQGKAISKGSGGKRSRKMEGVKGDAEMVVIVIDEDGDEICSVLRSADRKSSSESRRSSEKDEQTEPHCEGYSGANVKLPEENAVIILDEEDDEPIPVLHSPERKKSRRSSGNVGNACESGGSNEKNQTVGAVTKSKEGLLASGRITGSRSMNSEVALSPFIKKTTVGRQNGEPGLDNCEVEDNEVETSDENLDVTGDVEVKRKWKNRNSTMKFNDEIMVCLPDEVSVSENLVGDVVHEKHVNTVMGSDITLSIDGAQGRQGPETRNEEDIEEHELCTTDKLMEIVVGSVETRRKQRTRTGLVQDSPAGEKKIYELGSAHHEVLLHRDEILEPEVCFGSSQILGSPLSSNRSSSPLCLLLSELHGGQDFNAAARTPNTLIETDSSNRHNKHELQELIIYRNSEGTMKIFSDKKIDSRRSQLCSSFNTESAEAKQQPKNSPSSEKTKIDLKIFESFQMFPDSQRVADTNSEQFLAPFESIVFQEEINEIKGGETIKLEGSVQIIQDKMNHDGDKLCASEEQPQPVGPAEDLEGIYFAGDPLAKVDEAAPFGLSERVDNLMEKLFCLTKVLRGEIVPLSTDLPLPCEEARSCKESPDASKKEMKSLESFSSHEQESQILNPAEPAHDDCEKDISKSEVNMPKKTDEVAIIISPDALQGSSDLGKCMKSCKRNNTAAASPYKCDFHIKPTLEKTWQAGDVDGKKFLETRQGVLAEPEEAFHDNKFVSPSKLSSFDLEGFLKSKLNDTITNSPAEDINHFGTKCLSETSDSRSSPTSTQANAKYIVDILTDEVIRTSSEVSQGSLELWKCMESYEIDCAHNQPAEAESCGAGDIDVMDFLDQGARTNPEQVLEKIQSLSPSKQSSLHKEGDRNSSSCCSSKKVKLNSDNVTNRGARTNPKQVLEKIQSLSPSRQSNFHIEDNRNSSSSCSSKKVKLSNDNVTDIPGKYDKHFGSQCRSISVDGHSSLPNKLAYAKLSFDILDVESQEGSMLGADNLVDAVPSEAKASFGNNTLDPVEEISHNFCVSSSRESAKPKISNTPITNSAVLFSAGFMRDKENTQSTKMKYSSNRKIMNSTSTGSIRKPLQSVINQMIE